MKKPDCYFDIYFGKGVCEDSDLTTLNKSISSKQDDRDSFLGYVDKLMSRIPFSDFREIHNSFNETVLSFFSLLEFNEGIVFEVRIHQVDLDKEGTDGFLTYSSFNKDVCFDSDIETAAYSLRTMLV